MTGIIFHSSESLKSLIQNNTRSHKIQSLASQHTSAAYSSIIVKHGRQKWAFTKDNNCSPIQDKVKRLKPTRHVLKAIYMYDN